LRRVHGDRLLRGERLQRSIGERLRRETVAEEWEHLWDTLARLALVGAFFLTAYDFINRADGALLARFAQATPAVRRWVFLDDEEAFR
jgi:hypothetical protein